MNFPVTLATKSDQVALVIRALMALESPVMNLDCGERAGSHSAPGGAGIYGRRDAGQNRG